MIFIICDKIQLRPTKVNGSDVGFALQIDRNKDLINHSTFTINDGNRSYPTSVRSIVSKPENNEDFYFISGSYQSGGNNHKPFIIKVKSNPAGGLFDVAWANDYSTSSITGSQVVTDLLTMDARSPFFFGLGTIHDASGAKEMLLVRPRLDTGITSKQRNMCYQTMNAQFQEVRINTSSAAYQNSYQSQKDAPLTVSTMTWDSEYCTSFCGRDVFEGSAGNNTQATTVALPTVGVNENAVICSAGDEDWYSFNRTSSVRGMKITLNNFPRDYDIQLMTPSSGTISSVTSNVPPGSITRTITLPPTSATGTYYIRVFGINPGIDWHPFDGYKLKARY